MKIYILLVFLSVLIYQLSYINCHINCKNILPVYRDEREKHKSKMMRCKKHPNLRWHETFTRFTGLNSFI